MVVSTVNLTQAQVEKLLTAQAQDFEVKIQKLTDEAAKSRISNNDILKTLAESLGMEYNPEKKPGKDDLAAQIAAIQSKQQELENKAAQAEKAKEKIEKESLAKDLAKKAGLKDKIIKLIDLDAEDLQAEIDKALVEYPEFKEKPNVGGGGNPSEQFNSAMVNPYKKESLNLTHQYKLESTNPALAAKFKAEAGIK